MADAHTFTAPLGRFVSGDMAKKREKDGQGRPIKPEDQRYEFGIAYPKNDPAIGALIQQIATYAYNEYGKTAPHVAQRVANWMQTFDGFSMKISNGDAPNSRGVVNPNTVGHYVFWFSTSIAPNCCMNGGATQIGAEVIKRGWYVYVAGSCKINGLTDNNAGIYMNVAGVMLYAEGEEIVGGIDPAQLFAGVGQGAQLPPGARPIGSGVGMPGVGMPPMQPGQPAQMPAGMMPGFAPQQPAQMPGFMPPATPAPAAMPMGAPAGMQPFGVAGGGSPIASPGNGYPAYPGVLGMPQQ